MSTSISIYFDARRSKKSGLSS